MNHIYFRELQTHTCCVLPSGEKQAVLAFPCPLLPAKIKVIQSSNLFARADSVSAPADLLHRLTQCAVHFDIEKLLSLLLGSD